MWENFQKIMPKVAGKYNFAESLKAVEICNKCRTLIKKEFPEGAEKNITPKHFKNGILTIGASNPSWANVFQIKSHKIQSEINKKHGKSTVKRIKIVQISCPKTSDLVE